MRLRQKQALSIFICLLLLMTSVAAYCDAAKADYGSSSDQLIISGHVLSPDGVGVSRAQLCIANNLYYETSDDGYYAIRVPFGWSGTIIIRDSIFSFSPNSKSYTNVIADMPNQDFVAARQRNISGYVRKAGGGGASGVSLYADDKSAVTNEEGYYSICVPDGWSGTVNLWSRLYISNPENRSYTNVTSDLSDQNFEASPKPLISGHVRTKDGTGVSDLWINTSDNVDSCITDSDGYYAIGVSSGWSGTVTSSWNQLYSIAPDSKSYSDVTSDISDQNYEAISNPTISGYIRKTDGSGISGIEVYTNNGNDRCYTDTNGYYILHVQAGQSTSVMIWDGHGTYSFNPDKRSYTNITTDLSEQNFEATLKPVISGYVRKADGSGVSYVTIKINDTLGGWTDESGHYEIPVSTGWSGKLSASSNFYSIDPSERSYTNVTADIPNQDFNASPLPVISGYLRKADGSGLANLYVSADDSSINSTWTDENGYYAIGVPAGWSGSIKAPQLESYTFSPETRSYTNVTTDQPEQNFEAILKPIISGYVRRPDGTGIEGVFVRSDDYAGYCTTDIHGFYAVKVPSGWSGNINASSASNSFAPPSRPYTNVTANILDQNFESRPLPTVSGYVRKADGSGVSGVLVCNSVRTNEDGYYTINVQYGWSGTISVQLGSYTFSPEGISCTNVTADLQDQNFEAIPYKVISGYVRKSDGSGLENATISFDGFGSLQTDSNGYYSIGVPTGWSGYVYAQSDSYTLDPSSRYYTNVTEDIPDQNIRAMLMPVISGYVRLPDGSGLSGVSASSGVSWCDTDTNGYYSIKVPYGWSGDLQPWRQFYDFSPDRKLYTNVTADTPDQNFDAIPFKVISGYVRKEDGSGLSGVLVDPSGSAESGVTDASGHYAIRVPANWSGTVSISQDKLYTYTPERRSYSNVNADQPNQNFTAIPKLVISGYILKEDGSGLESATVTADHGAWCNTDADGHYSLHMPRGWSGIVVVESLSHSFSPASRSYTNITTDTPDQNYEAIPKLSISGYVRKEDGSGLHYATVYASGGNNSGNTDENGYYNILVPSGWTGNVKVSYSGYTFDPAYRLYSNVVSDVVDQNFIALNYKTISGHVRTADGTGVHGAFISNGSNANMGTYTDKNGNYSISVPFGWTGTVSVPKWSSYLTPGSRSYTNVKEDLADQDFIIPQVETISGRISTSVSDLGIDYVDLQSSDGLVRAARDDNGFYNFQVPYGWSGEVRAIDLIVDGLFSPPRRTYTSVTNNITDQDYQRIPCTYISGSIRNHRGQPIDGIRIYGDNGAGNTFTYFGHDYLLPVPIGWSGTVKVESPYYTFTPENRSYSDVQSEVENQNYEAIPAGSRISEIKKYPDGTEVTCLQSIVSASFPGFFYIESEDRTCGIKVTNPDFGSWCEIPEISVRGVIKTDSNGERYIDPIDYCFGYAFYLTPLWMQNRALGGANFFYDGSATAGQMGVTGGYGLNNIGLLVKISGKFTWVDNHTFTIDDGSGVIVKCVVPEDVALDRNWSHVSVTGISSLEKDGDTLNRLLRIRIQGDIVAY